ncbi:MAG: Uma2 family endonuclease [Blastocatellia bacterium]
MSQLNQSATAVALDEDFDKKYEIVDGVPEAKDMGSSLHSGVGTRLIIEMGMHVKLNKLGAVYGPDATFQIGSNERLPDVSFVAASSFPEEGETDKKWEIAPDLAVEIISPSEGWAKVNRKIHEYFTAGVRQVWLISLEEREIHVYDSAKTIRVLSEDDDLTSDVLLPGFHCRVSDLFQQPART